MSVCMFAALRPVRVPGAWLLVVLGLSACAEGTPRSGATSGIGADQRSEVLVTRTDLEPGGPVRLPADPVIWPAAGPIAIAQLVAMAQDRHPTIAAVRAAQAAAAARVRQAGTWDNPHLELSVGRTRPRQSGVEKDIPYGGSLSQRLTWWGTRNARVAADRAEQGAAEADGAVARLLLAAEVRRSAIAYAAAVEDLALAEADARIIGEVDRVIAGRLAAGDADRAESARTRLELATAQVRVSTRLRAATTAREVLGTWCGGLPPEDLRIADALMGGSASAATLSTTHPQLRALEARLAAASAEIDAERGRRIPDLTVGVFADREDEKDTFGLTLGIDIPLWDRHAGGIASAEAVLAQARAEAARERQALVRDQLAAQAALATARAEILALETQAVPAADELVRLRSAAFASGEGSLGEVLEARRAANAVRSDLLDARRRCALAVVDLGLATGEPQSVP